MIVCSSIIAICLLLLLEGRGRKKWSQLSDVELSVANKTIGGRVNSLFAVIIC